MKLKYSKNKVTKENKNGLQRGIAGGVVVSVLLTLGLTALEATAADKQIVLLKHSSALTFAVWLLSSGIGAFIAAKLAGEKRLPVALLTGGIYAGIMLLTTGLLYHAKFDGVLKGVMTIFVGAAGAGVLSSGSKGKKREKYRFR